LRSVSFAGLSASGLVGGHAFAYALVEPDPHHRAALLDATGHGYLPSLSWVLLAGVIAAVVAGVAAGYVHRHPVHGGSKHPARWLLPAQAASFVLLEVLERLSSGASLRTLSVSLLLVGILVQLLVGVVVVLLVAGLHRAGAILRALPRVAVPRGERQRLPFAHERPRRSVAAAANRVRAPPVLAH
jgi:hypothetical protein